MTFEVGSRFPYAPVNPGVEYCCTIPNAGLLEVFVYLKDVDETDVSGFNLDALYYGLFEYQHVPILLLHIPGVGVEAPVLINVLLISAEERDRFLASKIHSIALFLIDTDTNILGAIRVLDLDQRIGEDLLDLCGRQLNTFSGPGDVKTVYERLIEAVPFEEMVQQVNMVPSSDM